MQAKKLARGDDGSPDNAPTTVDGALKAYRPDLKAREANPYNAEWPRLHLTSVLLSKPVALLTATELKKWRDGLLGTMAPSTINRLCGCLCAALEQAAQHDKRIQNRDAWETGLAGLPNAQEVRNVIISRRQGARIGRRRLWNRSSVRTAHRYLGDHWRTSEPSRPAPRRRSAQSPGTTEVDDAEVGKGRRQKP